jgi:triosephosphate isomerase
VNKENIEQFTRLDVLDGVGATRASLDAQGFLAMVDRVASSGLHRNHSRHLTR